MGSHSYPLHGGFQISILYFQIKGGETVVKYNWLPVPSILDSEEEGTFSVACLVHVSYANEGS